HLPGPICYPWTRSIPSPPQPLGPLPTLAGGRGRHRPRAAHRPKSRVVAPVVRSSLPSLQFRTQRTTGLSRGHEEPDDEKAADREETGDQPRDPPPPHRETGGGRRDGDLFRHL